MSRQKRYLQALRTSDVETRLGQFKRRERTCPFCGRRFETFEEKETDVAIGSTMTRLVCEEFKTVADLSFTIKAASYVRHQLRE